MSRADSPLKDRMIFNVGARRSGTYWLQRIVASHPEVAPVPSESHLFSHGVNLLLERFHQGARGSPQPGKLFMDRELLLDAARDFCDRVFLQYLEPGIRYVSERTALHVRQVNLIAEVYPDARFAHIVRDGRDVARSLVAQRWGPATIEDAAREWHSSVVAARRAHVPGRYLEVRYEELLADPPGQIKRLLQGLGLPASQDVVEAAVAAARIAVNVDSTRPQVAAGKWSSDLSAEDVAAFEHAAGDLLDELGYERVASERRSRRAPSGLLARAGRVARGPILPFRRRDEAPPGTAGWTDPKIALGLLDRLIAAMQARKMEGVADLLESDAVLAVVTPRGKHQVTGERAREELVRILGEDPVCGGRQLRGEVFSAPASVAAVLEFQLPDRSEAERIFVLSSRRGRIASLAVYQLTSPSPSPSGGP